MQNEPCGSKSLQVISSTDYANMISHVDALLGDVENLTKQLKVAQRANHALIMQNYTLMKKVDRENGVRQRIH